MKKIKLFAYTVLGSCLLIACNKSEHWETSVTDITNITAYSANIAVNYDFGGKDSKVSVGLDYGTDPELKTGYQRLIEEKKSNYETVSMPQQLYANQTYYVRTFMACKKDTIWSEIISFTTLAEQPMACAVTTGEVYYSGHNTTELVGNLVEIEDPLNPGLVTYQAETPLGNLFFSFLYEPQPGYHHAVDKITRSYQVPEVMVSCAYNYDGANCFYKAKYLQAVYVTKDLEGNLAISFCELEMNKSGEGSCVEAQKLSGRLVN